MFNIEDFDIKLTTDLLGRNFIYTEEIDSTNKFLLNTKDYDTDGTVVLSEYQTEGRGRKSRVWYSGSGQNLTFSTLLKVDIKQEKMNLVNLGAAVAVANSLENLFQLTPNLKWPNDVLVNDKKIAGILLETAIMGDKVERLVIGIGINVNQHSFTGSSEFLLPPTSVKNEFKKEISRERLLSEVLNNFEEILKMVDKNPDKIIEDWKSRSKFLGENIRIVDDGDIKFGKFEDVDENGYLILKMGDKRERIYFGDVSLR